MQPFCCFFSTVRNSQARRDHEAIEMIVSVRSRSRSSHLGPGPGIHCAPDGDSFLVAHVRVRRVERWGRAINRDDAACTVPAPALLDRSRAIRRRRKELATNRRNVPVTGMFPCPFGVAGPVDFDARRSHAGLFSEYLMMKW